jgi:hypothetical protein
MSLTSVHGEPCCFPLLLVQSCLLEQRSLATSIYDRKPLRRRFSGASAGTENANPDGGLQVDRRDSGAQLQRRSSRFQPVETARSALDGSAATTDASFHTQQVQSLTARSGLAGPDSSRNADAQVAQAPAAVVTTATALSNTISRLESMDGASDDESDRSSANLSALSSLNTGELSSRGRGTVGSGASTEDGDESGSEDDDESAEVEEEDLYAQWQSMMADTTGGTTQKRRGCCARTASAALRLFLLTFCCCFMRGKSLGAKSSKANRACFILTERHPLRRACIFLSNHPRFDSVVLAVIFASSLCLAIDTPTLDPDSLLSNALGVLDVVWVVFFTFEMAVRLVALGIGPLGPGTYLRSGWNVLDGAIVAVSWLSFATDGNASFRSLRALRALRALRPLRVVRRLPGLRLVVHSLFRAFLPVMNVALVCSILFLIFA